METGSQAGQTRQVSWLATVAASVPSRPCTSHGCTESVDVASAATHRRAAAGVVGFVSDWLARAVLYGLALYGITNVHDIASWLVG